MHPDSRTHVTSLAKQPFQRVWLREVLPELIEKGYDLQPIPIELQHMRFSENSHATFFSFVQSCARLHVYLFHFCKPLCKLAQVPLRLITFETSQPRNPLFLDASSPVEFHLCWACASCKLTWDASLLQAKSPKRSLAHLAQAKFPCCRPWQPPQVLVISL